MRHRFEENWRSFQAAGRERIRGYLSAFWEARQAKERSALRQGAWALVLIVFVCFAAMSFLTIFAGGGGVFGFLISIIQLCILLIAFAVTATLVGYIAYQVTKPEFIMADTLVKYQEAISNYKVAYPEEEMHLKESISALEGKIEREQATLSRPYEYYDRNEPTTDRELEAYQEITRLMRDLKRDRERLESIQVDKKSDPDLSSRIESDVKDLQAKLWLFLVFGLAANLCAVFFFASWALYSPSAFEGDAPGMMGFLVFQLDVMLRGILIHLMEMLEWSLSDVRVTLLNSPLMFSALLVFRILETIFLGTIVVGYLRLRWFRRRARGLNRLAGGEPGVAQSRGAAPAAG